MTVREHLSQHEAAERLPLVTDAARDVDARIDPANAEASPCGSNATVNGLVDAVTRLGVDERFVDADGFG